MTDCWICYDADRTDAGPLIQPCMCRGDVSTVHHDCLKLWLIESNSNPDHAKCKVCKGRYMIQRGDVWLPAGFTIKRWLKTAIILMVMSVSAVGLFLAIRFFDHLYVKTISLGITILIQYVCLRWVSISLVCLIGCLTIMSSCCCINRLLGFNLLTAYNRAKMAAIKITGRHVTTRQDEHEEVKAGPASSSTSTSICINPVAVVKKKSQSHHSFHFPSSSSHDSNMVTTASTDRDNNLSFSPTLSKSSQSKVSERMASSQPCPSMVEIQ